MWHTREESTLLLCMEVLKGLMNVQEKAIQLIKPTWNLKKLLERFLCRELCCHGSFGKYLVEM